MLVLGEAGLGIFWQACLNHKMVHMVEIHNCGYKRHGMFLPGRLGEHEEFCRGDCIWSVTALEPATFCRRSRLGSWRTVRILQKGGSQRVQASL